MDFFMIISKLFSSFGYTVTTFSVSMTHKVKRRKIIKWGVCCQRRKYNVVDRHETEGLQLLLLILILATNLGQTGTSL